MRNSVVGLASGLLLLACGGADAADTDAEYTAKVMAAAPLPICQSARIVRTVNGTTETLKEGINEYLSLIHI